MPNGWGAHCTLVASPLKNGLQATIVSPKFKALKEFELEATVLMHDNFWKYLFVMCCMLYAPMCVLQLADQKTPAMDELYHYVLQADRMLPKWLKNAEEHSKHLMSSYVWRAMKSAGLDSASELSETDDSDDDGDDDDNNDRDNDDDAKDDNNDINDDNDQDDDGEEEGEDAMEEEEQYTEREMKVAKSSVNVMKCSKNVLGLVLKVFEC